MADDEATAQDQSKENPLDVERMSILQEFWLFLRENKAYWLAPIIIVFILLIVLLALTALSPASAPFIYTLF